MAQLVRAPGDSEVVQLLVIDLHGPGNFVAAAVNIQGVAIGVVSFASNHHKSA